MHDLHHHTVTSRTVMSAAVTMHPIIDQKPNDFSTVYSTLVYINQQAKQLHIPIPIPCIAFDRPLWIRAVDVVHCEKLHIVCQFGFFIPS